MEFLTLIVDDEETYAISLRRLLSRRGIRADVAGSWKAGLERARSGRYDLVILDHMLPDGSGLDLIPHIRALRPPPTVLMMTAFGTIENAVEAMRRGATDYVTKTTELPAIVERVVDAQRVQSARPEPATTDAVVDLSKFAGLLGESPAIEEARRKITEVARSPDTTVLLHGESGTGKGVAARALHMLSPRSKEPFVAIDCVSLPATLAESELFGHEKGAFTGAEQKKPGKLELAGRGTVLFDEIGDMAEGLQGKLLRVLEERTFDRIGGVKPVDFQARVISASHRDLGELVEAGKFRLDLYHRLSVFPIRIAPLRERGGDVLLLTEHFIAEYAQRMARRPLQLSSGARELLAAYEFPGNVRELKNVIERAVILATTDEITPELLPERVRDAEGRRPVQLGMVGSGPSGLRLEFRPGADTLEGFERRLLEEALKLSSGKKSRAAEILGISRFALLRRMEKFGL